MELIDINHPSEFNQGLMELGALVCTPTSPKCLLCPVREYCTAFNEGNPEELPVKTKKVKTKSLHYDVFVVQNEKGQFLLEKRPETGLLANMWQFPMFEQNSKAEHTNESLLSTNYRVALINREKLFTFKHIFSHLVWHMDSYIIGVKQKGEAQENGLWFTEEEMQKLPMPVPMQKIWQQYKKKTLNF